MSDGITDMMREKNDADAQEPEVPEVGILPTRGHGSSSPYTVTLTFDPTDPDGRRHLRDALQGSDMRLVLWEMDQWLRNHIKYGPGKESFAAWNAGVEDCLSMARKKLFNLCDEYSIRLDEE